MKTNYLVIIVILFFISCKDNDANLTVPEYKGKHSLSLTDVYASGFGAIKVTGIFNIAFDKYLREAGFILINNQSKEETKKRFDISSLQSKETVIFNNIPDGNFTVKSYLVNSDSTIYSQPQNISLTTNKDSDISLSVLYDYIDAEGMAVLGKNKNDVLSIALLAKNPVVADSVYLNLSGNLYEMSFVHSPGWTDGLYHYDVGGYVTDDMPDGRSNITILFDNQATIETNIILDKLTGKWEQIKSLFPGDVLDGVRSYFQIGKYGYFLPREVFWVSCLEAPLWRVDLENFTWKQLKSLNLRPDYILTMFSGGISYNNCGYILIDRASGNISTQSDYEVWKYDVNRNEWTLESKFPYGNLEYPVVFYLNNKIYVTAGRTSFYNSSQTVYNQMLYYYDIVNQKWSKKNTRFPQEITPWAYQYSAFSNSEDAIVVIPIGYGYNRSSEIWNYNENLDIWKQIVSPSSQLPVGGTGHFYKDCFVYAGGNEVGTYYDDVGSYNCYAFSADGSIKKQISSYPFRFSNGVSFLYNNRLFVGLGLGFYDSSVTLYEWKE